MSADLFLIALYNLHLPNQIPPSNEVISPDTIRNWCDEGLLEHKRDFRGWRWFENLDETVKKVEELLYGQPETVSAVESAAHKKT